MLSICKFQCYLKVGLLSLFVAAVILACKAPRSIGENDKRPDPDFHIYILAGQSNMAGRGPINDTFANMGHPNVYKLNFAGEWVPAKHPLHSDKPKMVGVGPGLSFGIEMAKANPGVRIGLIPCAVGGSPIEAWEPGGYHKSTKKYPYDEALVRIREAMKYGVIKGVVWHQGEANSKPGRELGYLNKLSALIERLRKEVHNPKLPFVAGELGRYREQYSVINELLKQLPQKVKYTRVVSSEGLVHKGDGTHFDSPSADEFGKRYAAAMIALENK